MRQVLFSILTLSIAAFAGSAWAAGQMKPGLWEMTIKSNMIPAMPKLSPQELEQMRKMGVDMPDIKDGGMVSKVCVTKEMAGRDEPPTGDFKEMGCETKNYKNSGNQYSFDVVCNNAEMKGQGTMKGAFSGNDKFSSTYQFKGVAHGQKVDQAHETAGKWVSADCGKVKPYDDIGKKK